jgi:aspyridone synthetase trans-acting enoyl reductase
MRAVENKVSMAEAACLGAGVVTAGMTLRDLGIPLTETCLGDLSVFKEDSGAIGTIKANTRPYSTSWCTEAVP